MYPDTTSIDARRSRTRALAQHTCQPGLARGDEQKKILGIKKEKKESPSGRKIKRATGYACETSSLSRVHLMICTANPRASSPSVLPLAPFRPVAHAKFISSLSRQVNRSIKKLPSRKTAWGTSPLISRRICIN